MNKILLISIAFLSALASCSTYQKTSISLSEAVDKGKVKTESSRGDVTVFKNIELTNGNYYGVLGKKRILLNDTAIPKVYLTALYKSEYHKVWVTPINSRTKIKGYLNRVNDSSILISPSQSRDTEDIFEIDVTKIETIQLREKGKAGRATLTGSLIGLGVGFGASLIYQPIDPCDYGACVGLALMGGIAGTITGLVLGNKKDEIKIEGVQSTFELHKTKLKQRAFTQ